MYPDPFNPATLDEASFTAVRAALIEYLEQKFYRFRNNVIVEGRTATCLVDEYLSEVRHSVGLGLARTCLKNKALDVLRRDQTRRRRHGRIVAAARSLRLLKYGPLPILGVAPMTFRIPAASKQPLRSLFGRQFVTAVAVVIALAPLSGTHTSPVGLRAAQDRVLSVGTEGVTKLNHGHGLLGPTIEAKRRPLAPLADSSAKHGRGGTTTASGHRNTPPAPLDDVEFIGEFAFGDMSQEPRAVAIDGDGDLYAFIYGGQNQCKVFDQSGRLCATSQSLDYPSECFWHGGYLYVKHPGGGLSKLDSSTLLPIAQVCLPDAGGHWLSSATTCSQERIYAASGSIGATTVQILDSDLRLLGYWHLPTSAWVMDATDEIIFVASRETDLSIIQAYQSSDTDQPTRIGEPLTVAGSVEDLCVLNADRVLLVLEAGELLEYQLQLEATGVHASWLFVRATRLQDTGWFTPATSLGRAAYDIRHRRLYVALKQPHARIASIEYTVSE